MIIGCSWWIVCFTKSTHGSNHTMTKIRNWKLVRNWIKSLSLIKRNRTGLSGGFWTLYSAFSRCGQLCWFSSTRLSLPRRNWVMTCFAWSTLSARPSAAWRQNWQQQEDWWVQRTPTWSCWQGSAPLRPVQQWENDGMEQQDPSWNSMQPWPRLHPTCKIFWKAKGELKNHCPLDV